MMKKRLTSLALSAMMVLSMVPATAFAAKDAGTPPTYNSATGCGTGLGLSIVKHGAALHGAALTLDSTLNVGTRITLTFPKNRK